MLASDEEGTRADDKGAHGQPDADDPEHQKVWISEDSLKTAFELLTGSCMISIMMADVTIIPQTTWF